MNSLLDMLLLPKGVYKRLNEKELTLYLGVAFIGGVDIIYPQITSNLTKLFLGKPQGVLFANILITIGLILLVGFIDAIFFAIPLTDLFNKVFRKETSTESVSVIRIMKIYIIAHLMTLPANALLYYFFDATELGNNMAFVYIASYIAMLVLIWFNAVIYRGVNSLYNFTPVFKTLVFPAVFTWNILLGIGLQYMIDNWIMKLFL
jgi:hypothetical protein